MFAHKVRSPRDVHRLENSCRQYRIRSSRGEESALAQQLLDDGSVARRTLEKCRLRIYNVDEGKSSKFFSEVLCRLTCNDLATEQIFGRRGKKIKRFFATHFSSEKLSVLRLQLPERISFPPFLSNVRSGREFHSCFPSGRSLGNRGMRNSAMFSLLILNFESPMFHPVPFFSAHPICPTP